MAPRSAPGLPSATPASATSPLKMHKRFFQEVDRRDELPRAKQGYLPSGAQAAHTPDACAHQTGEHCPISLNAR